MAWVKLLPNEDGGEVVHPVATGGVPYTDLRVLAVEHNRLVGRAIEESRNRRVSSIGLAVVVLGEDFACKRIVDAVIFQRLQRAFTVVGRVREEVVRGHVGAAPASEIGKLRRERH